MAEPLTVSIPHKLGKDEALRRIKGGLSGLAARYAQIFRIEEEIWSGDRLSFRLVALRQTVSGTLDVAEDHVRLEVTLPWLLARLAGGIQTAIRDRGKNLLEKK
jgi:Putative polyhydroxyalkanoic acid system protein (PHA_gran_rgn)